MIITNIILALTVLAEQCFTIVLPLQYHESTVNLLNTAIFINSALTPNGSLNSTAGRALKIRPPP